MIIDCEKSIDLYSLYLNKQLFHSYRKKKRLQDVNDLTFKTVYNN